MEKALYDPFVAVPIGQTVKSRITVDKTNLKALTGFVSFFMNIENENGEKEKLLLYSEKSLAVKGCQFKIYKNYVADAESLVGEIDGNFVATSYKIFEVPYDSTSCKLLCGSVGFSKNIAGMSGTKKMKVLIPSMNKDHRRVNVKEDKVLKKGEENTVELISKSSEWNTGTQQHELNFFGRAEGKSSKNMQLVTKTNDKYVVLQMCKHGTHYKLDYSYPLCAIQAFGIALTMFVKTINGI